MEKELAMYGVFVMRNGKWELVQTYRNLSDATFEVQYLKDCLGIVAKAFRKQ
jgi:hypothetical protein